MSLLRERGRPLGDALAADLLLLHVDARVAQLGGLLATEDRLDADLRLLAALPARGRDLELVAVDAEGDDLLEPVTR